VGAPIEELRTLAAAAPLAAPALGPYLEKVRSRAYTVTDADVAELEAAGCSEDEVFEQTVAVAIAEGLRRLDAGLEAIG
jgi:alkylhydroperoxidase family enzyme